MTKRIMFIRHAEKPAGEHRGVETDGTTDDGSLTVRGWQRAGALVPFFLTRPELKPRVIFACAIRHGEKSKRPMQTVTPLADLLKATDAVPLIADHVKDDIEPVMQDVLSRHGPVLVAWEHHRIPALVQQLPNPPKVPRDWPDDRFDLVWVCDRAEAGWSFSQVPQLVLPGDRAQPIS